MSLTHVERPARSAAGQRPRPYAKPGFFLSRVTNPLMVLFDRRTVLAVRGRKTGKILKVPMDPPFEWNGARYLVSPRGETHWVRNLRSAGEADLRRHGRAERIHVTELQGAGEHDAVVRAYADTITCNCRKYMAQFPDPADHPVFRIEGGA